MFPEGSMVPQNVVFPLPENTRREDDLTPATTGMDLEVKQASPRKTDAA